jgi:hypothetical protein
MHTQDEIVTYLGTHQSWLGFNVQALIPFLDFEHARSFLKDEVTAEEWEPTRLPLTEEGVLAEMREYMEFAWDKVENHRGISANRNVEKMEAWVWLLGRDDVLGRFLAAPYPQYGAPRLAQLCRDLSFPIPDGPGLVNMIAGRPCHEGCEGCAA